MSYSPQELALRQDLIDTCRNMNRLGINKGTSGNVSARHGEGLLITPTGIAYEALQPEQIVQLDWEGNFSGDFLPSSEWRFHRDILKARPDVNAIVHTHSTHAVALSCVGKGIPAFHYMVAVAGGADIRCAPYATFGTEELARHAVTALEGRRACLLANHGVVATGPDLASALKLAGEVENLAMQYRLALQVGTPNILDDAEMERVVGLFRTYGKAEGDHDADLVFGGGERP